MKTRSLDPGVPAVLLTARFTRRAVLGTLAAVGLAACGGGGDGIDSGGTGGAPTQQSFTNGSITGFGSIIVNGVRFDDSQAVIVDDEGRSRGRGDLALGMVVDIDAGAIATDAVEDKQSGVAREACGQQHGRHPRVQRARLHSFLRRRFGLSAGGGSSCACASA